MYEDTIAAISTPLGEGGIGIVRLSGSEAREIAGKIFRGKLTSQRLSHGHVIDPETNETIDEVMVSYMAAPRTYTGEDVVEINCHGGPIPLQCVLKLALRHGARPANPGEFTLRAFLNGRIDLAQAESVMSIIGAKTEASLRLAMQGLEGRLSAEIKSLRGQLMPVLAYLTARIDFPEDEVEPQNIIQPLKDALQELRELIATADSGIVYRHGVRTAIVGRPNVGKSSLLNRLLRQDRSIVTPVPGTTRDTIEEIVNLKGLPFILVDTAGIVHSQEQAEALGVERSRKAIEQADLVLLVIDISEPIGESDREIIDSIGDRTALVVANKCDLAQKAKPEELGWETVFTSAKTGEGLNQLEEKMIHLALGGQVFTSDTLMVDNPRHKSTLDRAERNLSRALSSALNRMPDDFISIDLTSALNSLGEITGETVQEELLETIFSNFCIGK